jgi:small subunit ribosomal protein S4
MGDPKKIRKKYETPSHPWIKSRIDEEKKLAREFGTRTKKEIWKAETVLKKFKSQAKKLIALTGKQTEVETAHLYRRVKEMGLIQGEASFDAILGLDIDAILSRRLQTILFKKGLARTPSQARQFIVHGHVFVDGKKITSPSYLVTIKEESNVEFAVNSALYNHDHPERASVERLAELVVAKDKSLKEAATEEAKNAELEEKAKREGIEEQEPSDEEVAKVTESKKSETKKATEPVVKTSKEKIQGNKVTGTANAKTKGDTK